MTKGDKIKASIGIALLLSGAALFVYSRQQDKKSKLISGEADPDRTSDKKTPPATVTPATKAAKASAPSGFPLKVGSKNIYVGQLQTALGIKADNVFGAAQTLPALKAATGLSQVDTPAQLAQIISKINSVKLQASAVANNWNRSQRIITEFKKGGAALMCISATNGKQCTRDTMLVYYPTGMQYPFQMNKSYNSQDWKPIADTQSGKMVIECTTGKLKGYYLVDPNAFTLVEEVASTDSSNAKIWSIGALLNI